MNQDLRKLVNEFLRQNEIEEQAASKIINVCDTFVSTMY
jgi:hypothetical protein